MRPGSRNRIGLAALSLAALGLAAWGLAPFSLAEVHPAPRLIRSAFYDPAATASIGAGSSLHEVRQVFGRLPDELDGSCFYMDGDGAAVDGMAKTLMYPGFFVTLQRYPGAAEYTTTRVVIHAPQLWVTPGLAVGMSDTSLRALLGKPEVTGVDGHSGGRIQHYSFSPRGDLRVHLSHGRVSSIEINAR